MWRCFGGGLQERGQAAAAAAPTAPASSPAPPEQEAPYVCSSSTAFLDVSAQLQELFSGASSGGQVNDTWGTLQRAADIVASAGKCHISIHVLLPSRQYTKVVRSQGMPVPNATQPAWELSPIGEFPSVLEVAAVGKQTFVQVPDRGDSLIQPCPYGGGTDATGPSLFADYAFLRAQAQCTSFTHIPLLAGATLQGTMLIASRSSEAELACHRWVSALWPMVAMFLVDSSAVRLCTMLEKLQATTSIHSLAWTVATELNTWLEWCHPDDTEARLVLLNEDKPQALVLHRSTAALCLEQQWCETLSPRCKISPTNTRRRSDVPRDDESSAGSPMVRDALRRPSLRVGFTATAMGPIKSRSRASVEVSSDSLEPSKQVLQDGLQGTQMSLHNTLTRRCTMDGSKLLFVSDVMSALRTYGEPWNDIFLDQAVVSNPTWAIAAPIKLKDRPVAAIIWLSHTRLNASMLAQATRSTLVPLLHALSQQLASLMERQRTGVLSPTCPLSFRTPAAMSEDPPSLYQQFVSAGISSIKRLNSTSGLMSSSLHPSTLRHGSALEPRPSEDDLSTLLNSGTGGVAAGAHGAIEPPLVRFTVSRTDCASTQSLVRAYQTAITQHQRTSAGAGPESFGQVEEIEVIAKVGQGAFGSVYVAMWKGQMVAAKVMKQADGRKAMRMAWEMAVAQALQHPNIITVHAVLMDVTVEKHSARTLRFHPFMPVQDMTLAPEPALPAEGDKAGPRCHVIIMEYCSIGPLHNYVAEKRFLNSGSFGSRRRHVDRNALSDARVQRSHSCYGEGAHGMLLSSTPNLPLILSVLVDVASAMVYLQRSGFIHLDLKPENILLKVAQNEIGFVAKVSDFGLSDLDTADGPLIGEMGGTLTHIAPEIITQRKATKACDVYSFGICMYELYTCRRPYADLFKEMESKARDKEILRQVTQQYLRPQFPHGASTQYVALAQYCWAADPALRPSFLEVLAELRSMQAADAVGSAAARKPAVASASADAIGFARSSNSFSVAKRSASHENLDGLQAAC